MTATARSNSTMQTHFRELEKFRQSIESWERHGREAGQDGDAELTAGYAEDVADLRAILRLIEAGALHEAAEVVDCLDTVVRPAHTTYLNCDRSTSRSRTGDLRQLNTPC